MCSLTSWYLYWFISFFSLGFVAHSHLVAYSWSTWGKVFLWRNHWQPLFWILHLVSALEAQMNFYALCCRPRSISEFSDILVQYKATMSTVVTWLQHLLHYLLLRTLKMRPSLWKLMELCVVISTFTWVWSLESGDSSGVCITVCHSVFFYSTTWGRQNRKFSDLHVVAFKE